MDFYGYDEGDLEAQVTFEAQAPTLRSDGGDQVLLTDSVFIGEDDNAGDGSAAASTPRTYRLDFTGITPIRCRDST